MMSDSFLSDAGGLFFAVWSIIVSAVGLAAFGRDMLPSKAHLDPAQKFQPADQPPPRTRRSSL
jgi:hypothetical protein